MARVAAVGVYDDLAPGQARVPSGAAHDKAPRGIDINLGALVQQLGRNNGLDDMFNQIGSRVVGCHLGPVLRRDDHGVNAAGASISSYSTVT